MFFCDGAENGEADGVIAADADAAHTGFEKRSDSLLDAAKRVFDRERIHGEIAEVSDAILRKGIRLAGRDSTDE